MADRISLRTLSELAREPFVELLGPAFEHSPWIAEQAFDERPFASRAELHSVMCRILAQAPLERRVAIIAAHPDLAVGRDMTEESVSEQQSAGLDRLDVELKRRLVGANEEYRSRFGFSCIVCVRRAGTLDAILAAIERRTDSTRDEQIDENISEICEIAGLRLADLVAAGWVTTHVLDTTRGEPGAGMEVTIATIEDGTARTLKTLVTNADGRTDEPLLSEDEFAPGRYEVRFRVGPYFERRGVPTSSPPYLDEVPIRVHLAEDAHYHVPLIVSPWGYTTYRGS
ncbi:MAG: 2-oxo-4-hydroxy-4-carboxy-5-ureidoimidazoline decarboxylase [Solirubrobacteraceae bacterium]|nr:2-oxo-4-hydroxy-4-carboxy-5-ureidoimidazoline decarboxylase [Solirubrobacteraceae bacterium]